MRDLQILEDTFSLIVTDTNVIFIKIVGSGGLRLCGKILQKLCGHGGAGSGVLQAASERRRAGDFLRPCQSCRPFINGNRRKSGRRAFKNQ